MIDITSIDSDLNLIDTQTQKATNLLSVQVGSLEYAPDFGIDLRYFLSEEFRFENDSFKAYLIERLAANSINVSTVSEIIESLYSKYTFNISPSESGGGLVAR